MTEETYHQKKRKTMLNRAKDFYENNKKVLGKKARNKYRELYQKENMEGTDHMSEKKKQKLKEYQQIIVRLKNQNKKVLPFFCIV